MWRGDTLISQLHTLVSYVCSFSQTREGKAIFHNSAHKIFCKATGINSFVTNPSLRESASGVPKAAHLYFPVIPASVKCLSAFPQGPVYFLPHFAVGTSFLPAENKLPPPRPLSSPPSPLSPTLKPVLSAHDDQVGNCRGCWWSIDCGSLPPGRKYLFHFSSLLSAYNLHPLALQIWGRK